MITRLSYFWVPPQSPNRPSQEPEPALATVTERCARLPRINQVISWVLPSPQTAGYEPPAVIAYGNVVAVGEVEEAGAGVYTALLERCYNAMSYDELCFCVGAQVVGFHPDFGCVEGELIGLLPQCQLAGIADPLLEPDDEDDDRPVIWVDWMTVWTVQGLEIMAEQEAEND